MEWQRVKNSLIAFHMLILKYLSYMFTKCSHRYIICSHTLIIRALRSIGLTPLLCILLCLLFSLIHLLFMSVSIPMFCNCYCNSLWINRYCDKKVWISFM